jgi:hypothetical protein
MRSEPTAVCPVAPLAVEQHAPDTQMRDDGLRRVKRGEGMHALCEMSEMGTLGGG